MHENEGTQNRATPESTWKSITENEVSVTMTTDELCRKVRERETRNHRVRRIEVLLAIAFGIGFFYSVLTIDQGWIRLAWAWLCGGYGVLAWTMDRRRPVRNEKDSCAVYLQREYKSKRDRLLEVRRDLMLVFLPAVLASWLGGGPAARAKSLGIDPSSWLFQLSGPLAWVIAALALAFIWRGYGQEAEKVTREIEALERHIRN